MWGFFFFIFVTLLLLLFSCQVVSDSLWAHGLQHARLPCPSPSPGVCSNSCPLSQRCHPTISFSVVPFSCPPSLLAALKDLLLGTGLGSRVAPVNRVLQIPGEPWRASRMAVVELISLCIYFPMWKTGKVMETTLGSLWGLPELKDAECLVSGMC